MLAIRLLAAVTVALALGPRQDDKIVPGKYIVSLKQSSETSSIDSHIAWVKDTHDQSLARRDEKGVNKVWRDSFRGYSGEFDEDTLNEIRQSDDVCTAPLPCE